MGKQRWHTNFFTVICCCKSDDKMLITSCLQLKMSEIPFSTVTLMTGTSTEVSLLCEETQSKMGKLLNMFDMAKEGVNKKDEKTNNKTTRIRKSSFILSSLLSNTHFQIVRCVRVKGRTISCVWFPTEDSCHLAMACYMHCSRDW